MAVSADYVWMNGEFVAFEDAKVSVLTHALHYGTGVFEGVRAYETPRGTAVFRHQAHLDRLFQSARTRLAMAGFAMLLLNQSLASSSRDSRFSS